MIKDITVYLNGLESDEGRIEQAAALCHRFDAHLTGLYLNVLPEIIASADLGVAGSYDWSLHESAMENGDVAEGLLRDRLLKATPLSEFRRRDLYPNGIAAAMAAQARVSDLTVVSRPYAEEASSLDVDVVEGALFGSGRGTLIVPATGPAVAEFPRILLGWRNSRESARAMAEALPMLRAAEQVFVAVVDEEGAPEEDGEEPAADIARHLGRHGVRVEVRHLSRWNHTGEALLNEAKIVGANLIVAGAYGHSRLREWVLGGTTRDLLRHGTVPLLMAH
jgi:nucleotide-binding universal stress UspA family protein